MRGLEHIKENPHLLTCGLCKAREYQANAEGKWRFDAWGQGYCVACANVAMVYMVVEKKKL